MHRLALASLLLLLGCGLGAGSSELAAPSVAALTQADGSSTVRLSWSDRQVSRDYLSRVTVTAPGTWLTQTTVSGDRELELSFGAGFASEMGQRGRYDVTLLLPEQAQGRCPCCRHASHVMNVELTFDGAGDMTGSSVSQVVR